MTINRFISNTGVHMAKKTPKGRAAAPLIMEPHPIDYAGLPFLTLIQYRKQPMLAVVDNADDETVKAYVLDLCGPEEVSEELILSVVAEWYNSADKVPLSIEFSRRGLTSIASKIYRSVNIEFISRIIGPVPIYPMSEVKSIKRRRRRAISSSVEVTYHVTD